MSTAPAIVPAVDAETPAPASPGKPRRKPTEQFTASQVRERLRLAESLSSPKEETDNDEEYLPAVQVTWGPASWLGGCHRNTFLVEVDVDSHDCHRIARGSSPAKLASEVADAIDDLSDYFHRIASHLHIRALCVRDAVELLAVRESQQ